MPPEDPTVDDGPVVRLKAHAPYNLTCRASGAKPAAEITWYREGELQEAAVYSKVTIRASFCSISRHAFILNAPGSTS